MTGIDCRRDFIMKKLENHRDSTTFQDRLILFLYSLFIILTPFYFWKSGLPQVADIIMVVLFLVYILSHKAVFRRPIDLKPLVRIGSFFVAHIVIVNAVWTLLLGSTSSFWLSTVFYIYNFLVFLLIISLSCDYRSRLIEVTFKSTVASLVVQFIMYVGGGGFSGGRMVVGFNNPNQLGYYALLTASLLMFSSKRVKVRFHWFIIGIFVSAVLCFASLSKAAIVSYFGLVVSHIILQHPNKQFKRRLIVFLLLASVAGGIILQYSDGLLLSNPLISAVQRRIMSIGHDSDDSLEGRGYDRIWKHPEYWIFGAGEGEYYRFGVGMEFHSTLGNLQVSYGILGLGLFLIMLFLIMRHDRYQNAYIILFLMMYGLTHNGIRNTLLWILLGLLATSE